MHKRTCVYRTLSFSTELLFAVRCFTGQSKTRSNYYITSRSSSAVSESEERVTIMSSGSVPQCPRNRLCGPGTYDCVHSGDCNGSIS